MMCTTILHDITRLRLTWKQRESWCQLMFTLLFVMLCFIRLSGATDDSCSWSESVERTYSTRYSEGPQIQGQVNRTLVAAICALCLWTLLEARIRMATRLCPLSLCTSGGKTWKRDKKQLNNYDITDNTFRIILSVYHLGYFVISCTVPSNTSLHYWDVRNWV